MEQSVPASENTPISNPETPTSLENRLKLLIGLLLSLAALVVIGIGIAALQTSKSTTTEQLSIGQKKIGLFQSVKRLDGVVDGFKEEMARLGYVEGKNVVYEYQNSDRDPKKSKEIAKSFVDRNFDLVLAIAEAPLPIYEETVAANIPIPIVFTNVNAPVQVGIVKSLQSSGNHVTGVRTEAILITTKKLEFLKQLSPTSKKIAVFSPAKELLRPPNVFLGALTELKEVAPRFAMEIVVYELTKTGDQATLELQKIADGIKPGAIDAIMIVSGDATSIGDDAKIVIALAKRLKVPSVVTSLRDVEAGAILNYNHVPPDLGRQAAVMADKIFKGTKPSDIPIEAPRKFALNVNLKAAREIGIVIPDAILAIADKKIE